MHALLLVHATATIAMAAIAWFIQVVHYPLFALVGDDFAAYENAHARRTTLVVAPVMTAEAATALVLVVVDPNPLAVAGLVGVVIVWVSTATLQVPCHRKLAAGFDPATFERLVTTSWLRTVTWTARSGIAIGLLA